MNDYDNLRAAVAGLEEKNLVPEKKNLVPEKNDIAAEDVVESDASVDRGGFTMDDYDKLRAAIVDLEEKGLVPEKNDVVAEGGAEADPNMEKKGFAVILKEKAKEMLAVKTEEFAEKLMAAVENRKDLLKHSSVGLTVMILLNIGLAVGATSGGSTESFLTGGAIGVLISPEVHYQVARLKNSITNKQNGAAVEAE